MADEPGEHRPRPTRIGPSRGPMGRSRVPWRTGGSLVLALAVAAVLFAVVDHVPGPNRQRAAPGREVVGGTFPAGLRPAPDSAGPRVTFAVAQVELSPPEPGAKGRVCRRYLVDVKARVSGRPRGVFMVLPGRAGPDQLMKTSDTEWHSGPFSTRAAPLCAPEGSTRTVGRGIEVGIGRDLRVIRRRAVRPTRVRF